MRSRTSSPVSSATFREAAARPQPIGSRLRRLARIGRPHSTVGAQADRRALVLRGLWRHRREGGQGVHPSPTDVSHLREHQGRMKGDVRGAAERGPSKVRVQRPHVTFSKDDDRRSLAATVCLLPGNRPNRPLHPFRSVSRKADLPPP
jgi:hypothetical protein